MALVPLIGPTYDLDSRAADVQRLVNMYLVPLEPGNERTRYVFKDVPGLETPAFLVTPDAHICTEGPTWTARTIPAANYKDQAWGADRFMLVGGEGSDEVIAFSTDFGATWTEATTIPVSGGGTIPSVAYGNGFWLAGLNAVAVIKSTDGGVTWIEYPSSSYAKTSLRFLNSKFWFISAGSSTNLVRETTDGISYTSRTMPATTNWQDMAYSGTRHVALALDRMAYSDDDGVTWNAGASFASGSWNRMQYGNGVFVAIDQSGFVKVTADGVTVTTVAGPANFRDILFAQGVFISCGAGDEIYTSEDGLTWTLSDNLFTAGPTWGRMVTDGNGHYFVPTTATGGAVLGNSGACG